MLRTSNRLRDTPDDRMMRLIDDAVEWQTARDCLAMAR